MPLPANPFGYVDHSGYSGAGAQLVYGQRPDGSYVHVSEVRSGLASDCVCPACGERLVARKGPLKVDHFGHHSSNGSCGAGAETNAHIWAKEVLAAQLRIKLPAVKAEAGNELRVLRKPAYFAFVSAELERRDGDLVPDVILTTATGKRLHVEVFVTHRCGGEKVEKLRHNGTASIEVDLSGYRRCQNRDQIELALLEAAPRWWLFNQRAVEASDALQGELDAAAERKAAAVRRGQEQRAAQLRQQVERLLFAAEEARNRLLEGPPPPLVALADRYEEDECVGMPIAGDGFIVSSLVWQSAVQSRFLSADRALDWEGGGLTEVVVFNAIRDCIHPTFHMLPSQELRKAVKEHVPAFRFPDEAIHSYLSELTMDFSLEGHGHGFMLGEGRAKALRQHRAKREASERRFGYAMASVTNIVEMVPEEERPRFSIDYWLEQRVPSYSSNLRELADEAGDEWRRFESALGAIETMMRGGEAVIDNLGLPIVAEIERAQERVRLKLEKEADGRQASLTNDAKRLLGSDAREWLQSAPAEDELCYIDLARKDVAGLARAHAKLEQLHRARTIQKERDRVQAVSREALRRKAAEAFDGAHLSLFLKSHHPVLGASPWDYCTDHVTLRACVALLPTSQRRTSRRPF